jgi:hypothetical protein
VRPVAGAGPSDAPFISLRNVGAKTANLTGTRLATPFSPDVLTIADRRECAANATLEPGRIMTFTPRSEADPCGFPFPLNATGSVRLTDVGNGTLAEASWADQPPGAQVRGGARARAGGAPARRARPPPHTPALTTPPPTSAPPHPTPHPINPSPTRTQIVRWDDGNFKSIAPGRNVLQLLQDLGQYSTLLAALKARPHARPPVGMTACAPSPPRRHGPSSRRPRHLSRPARRPSTASRAHASATLFPPRRPASTRR